MKYLIKFGSEITIKSDGVRKQCIKRLKTNILTHLDYNEIDAKCSGNWDRLVVEVSDLEEREKVIEVLKSIS
jgi:adenylyl- and sulfurtransferase ThiI